LDWRITKCGQISSSNWSGAELQNCGIHQEHEALKTRAGTDYKFQGGATPKADNFHQVNECDIKLSFEHFQCNAVSILSSEIFRFVWVCFEIDTVLVA